MNKRILLVALCLVLVVAFVLPGCAPARRPYDNTNQGTRTGYTGTGTGAGANPGTTGYGTTGTGYGTTGKGTGTGYGMGTGTGYGTTGTGTGYGMGTGTGYGTTGTGYGTSGINATTSVSDRIATAVRQINGVQNATAVVTGKTAYVGVTLSGTTGTIGTIGTTGTTAAPADIKSRVAQMVRATGNGITTVYVSTDAGFINRLKTIDTGLRSGSPISGFTTELRSLIKGITPAR